MLHSGMDEYSCTRWANKHTAWGAEVNRPAHSGRFLIIYGWLASGKRKDEDTRRAHRAPGHS
jgi:hypothetical protein